MSRILLVAVAVSMLAAIFVHEPSEAHDGSERQIETERQQIWTEFESWLKTQPLDTDPFAAYEAKLRSDGVSSEEIQKRLKVILDLYPDRATEVRPAATRAFFDRLFSRPAAASNTTPSALVVEAIKTLTPGTALDVGMGDGRNSIYLARQGWTVTGYDISTEALAAAQRNAQKAGVRITAVEASHDSFDFGVNRWDLIVMTFAWAPVADSGFISRLRRSLRAGGIVVYENFVAEPNEQISESVHALDSNEAPKVFAGFRILRCEETVTKGDWGGPNGDRLVRLIARKRQATGR